MMSAVFTDTLLQIRQEDVARRNKAHKQWVAHVYRCATQLFNIADEDSSETLDRNEVLRILLIIQRRQALVDRGEAIPDDSLTQVMVDMAKNNINMEDALRSLFEWLKDRTKVGTPRAPRRRAGWSRPAFATRERAVHREDRAMGGATEPPAVVKCEARPGSTACRKKKRKERPHSLTRVRAA
jgi:hypothetical protein